MTKRDPDTGTLCALCLKRDVHLEPATNTNICCACGWVDRVRTIRTRHKIIQRANTADNVAGEVSGDLFATKSEETCKEGNHAEEDSKESTTTENQ